MKLLKLLPASGDHLTPRETVAELDKYIVGQKDAKRSVAIALRNRWRRQQVPEALRDEIAPKNIIMIGPTGVGKTEIARRLAKLTASPFLKIEASKFTEVGYVGRDVESMVRDLMELAVNHGEGRRTGQGPGQGRGRGGRAAAGSAAPGLDPGDAVRSDGKESAEGTSKGDGATPGRNSGPCSGPASWKTASWSWRSPSGPPRWWRFSPPPAWRRWTSTSRTCWATSFPARPSSARSSSPRPGNTCSRKRPAASSTWTGWWRRPGARWSSTASSSWMRSTRSSAGTTARGPDVSREGVQRDLLPIVEGTTVNSKYGMLRTDHILFIASGAFHLSKPSDLIPEMQGRFPIRVELQLPGGGGVRTHPDGAGKRPDQAVPGPAEHRRHPAHLHRRRRSKRSPAWPRR